MKPSWILRGVLLASVAAFAVAAMPGAASAGPKHCPPGLAKKGSCIPPGHRQQVIVVEPRPVIVRPRVYVIGDYIPREVVYQRVYYTEYSLPRPREGHFYARIGGDLYLLAEATQRVIEAINLVDAATR